MSSIQNIRHDIQTFKITIEDKHTVFQETMKTLDEHPQDLATLLSLLKQITENPTSHNQTAALGGLIRDYFHTDEKQEAFDLFIHLSSDEMGNPLSPSKLFSAYGFMFRYLDHTANLLMEDTVSYYKAMEHCFNAQELGKLSQMILQLSGYLSKENLSKYTDILNSICTDKNHILRDYSPINRSQGSSHLEIENPIDTCINRVENQQALQKESLELTFKLSEICSQILENNALSLPLGSLELITRLEILQSQIKPLDMIIQEVEFSLVTQGQRVHEDPEQFLQLATFLRTLYSTDLIAKQCLIYSGSKVIEELIKQVFVYIPKEYDIEVTEQHRMIGMHILAAFKKNMLELAHLVNLAPDSNNDSESAEESIVVADSILNSFNICHTELVAFLEQPANGITREWFGYQIQNLMNSVSGLESHQALGFADDAQDIQLFEHAQSLINALSTISQTEYGSLEEFCYTMKELETQLNICIESVVKPWVEKQKQEANALLESLLQQDPMNSLLKQFEGLEALLT